MGTSSKELERKLRKVAVRQHGCFTAAQAIAAGYADSVHLYHVKNGSWHRISRGVYRLAGFPDTPAARCLAALLWTRGKTGGVQGILAAETARQLVSGSLSPEEPIRLLVPKGFRRTSDGPHGIQVLIVEMSLHKSSKIQGIPCEEINVTHSDNYDYIKDKPDYFDWIDYQDSLCGR